jgi:glutamine synthetase
MSVIFPDLLAEVRSFRAEHPALRYVDLIALDIPGHFYGKRYPIDMLEKVAAGAPAGNCRRTACCWAPSGGSTRLR